MRHISERAESKEYQGRCQLINACLIGSSIPLSDAITFTGKRSYVGILYRINEIIKRNQEITRSHLIEEIDICWVDIRDAVRKLVTDGAITEDYKKNSHHILRAAK